MQKWQRTKGTPGCMPKLHMNLPGDSVSKLLPVVTDAPERVECACSS
jgi:hypothetical protein